MYNRYLILPLFILYMNFLFTSIFGSIFDKFNILQRVKMLFRLANNVAVLIRSGNTLTCSIFSSDI